MDSARSRRFGDTLINMENISLSFGGINVLTDVSVRIREHEILAIIGPNGAGKSSLLNCISGVYHPQKGTITFKGETRKKIRPHHAATQGIARTFQNIALFKSMTVLDNIKTGCSLRMKTNFLQQALYLGAGRKEELEHREKVERIIDFLRIESIRKTSVGSLPYGLQKRVELGRALAADPEVLLLDEPMSGMNIEEKQDICRFILDIHDGFGTTIILIEHDMQVVMDISDRVMVLDYGKKIADGSPEDICSNQEVINAYLGVDRVKELLMESPATDGTTCIAPETGTLVSALFLAVIGRVAWTGFFSSKL